MELHWLGTETTGDQSPTLYSTDRESYVIQGWIVGDTAILAKLGIAEDETCVEVPQRLMAHLAKDRLAAGAANGEPPVVHIAENGNYIIRGQRVTDPDALAGDANPRP